METQSFDQLRELAHTIKTEILPGANTTQRIGSMFESIVSKIEENSNKIKHLEELLNQQKNEKQA
ncbi:MAG: hypothetical protein LBQ39_07060 [Tannerellaceae bacterium]|jgi:hypothetical protein|nr:hypothetical protein [Tannerellaceae bacterium]